MGLALFLVARMAQSFFASGGRRYLVDIGFDPAYNNQPGYIPVAGIQGIEALVDTGATESCIDSLVATQLNLPIIDRRTVSGIGGSQEISMHLAQIYIPSLSRTIYGAFAGVHLVAGGQQHKALIGRTFLIHCKMVYDGLTGSVNISCA